MTSTALPITIVNQTTHPIVYCYIVGLSSNNNDQLMFISSDGCTPYLPPNVTSTVTPLQQDCSIQLGCPGKSISVTIPHMDSARMYFSFANKLKFFLNPGSNGPACVQPSPSNPSDPNYNCVWDFTEFTFNSSCLYFNITYVDFCAMPVAASLVTTTGQTDHVAGMPINGVRNICNELNAQTNIDGQPWSSLIQTDSSGDIIRIISPNLAAALNSSSFAGYYDCYVNQVWKQYASVHLSIDTQAQWGVVSGEISNNAFSISTASFAKPSTQDIFSCSTGPFACGSDPLTNCLIPRLAAAFNRSTLLSSCTTPDPAGPSSFYVAPITNHYAKAVHCQLLDGRGYAFPYDDVAATGGPDQSGSLYTGNPQALTVTVGGNGAYVNVNSPVINQ
jgi:Beta-1,3-glucanase